MDNYTQQLTTQTVSQLGTNRLEQFKTTPTREEKIADIAEDFEAIFITQMLQHMFADIKTDGIFGGGHAEETWRSLLLDEYGKTVSQAGGVGIAQHVQQELLRLQEV